MFVHFMVLLLFSINPCYSVVYDETGAKEKQNCSIDIVHEKDDRLLLFATLDGTLAAVEKKTGTIKWKIKERPIVQVPRDTSNAIIPIFLPDPRDGSLYLLGTVKEPLKKLPFTIPQLVSSSPCRSTDGILYTGKKKDTWFKLDPRTGNKQQILGWDDHSPTCPIDKKKSIYIGRTKYDIRMVDAKKPKNKWNVTFYGYAATPMSKEQLSNYEFYHFTSTSSGRLITLDRRRGNFLWEKDLGSPIIGAYLLDSQGLISIPFTSLANHTIAYLVTQLMTHNGLLQNPNHMKLYPTLYIGEHMHGLYALPSLVDQNVVTITASDTGPLLLGGPHAPERPQIYPEYPLPGHNYRLPKDFYEGDYPNFQSLPNFENNIIIFTGHYNVPPSSDKKFITANVGMRLLTDESSKRIAPNKIRKHRKQSVGIQTDFKETPAEEQETAHTYNWTKKQYNILKLWINRQENKGLKISLVIMTGCVISMFWYLRIQIKEIQTLSQNGSRSSQQGSNGQNQITAFSEELPNGLVKVGKITFHPEQLLGKGCEGTFVYRGEFDNRRVAVKRLLPECFTFADREVALLRESDAHPNVIRYYCMEQDRMFRYIALELCQATLSDYVQGHCDIKSIKPIEILRQATMGLSHLHSLDIVHRDIKPHNVLLSVPNSRGEVRAMISDFGLCKKLQVGRVSFSRRSGITGTDGWIAPEMLNGSERTTYAVDLFSLGCLLYYVLSEGAHPFGDALRRQANILMGEYNLSDLKGADWQVNIQKPLLSALISSVPENRPSCKAVLEHPVFWSYTKILSFLQDVSDRVEKAEPEDNVLKALENNSKQIVKLDWRMHIHEEVATDLRKYRTYYGESVRDLLRALRNKKHHFRELSTEAQKFLGEIPEAFTNYWTSRFPLLLVHSWIRMQCVADEKTFKSYYHETYRYLVSQFEEQIKCYYLQNPIILPSAVKNDTFDIKKINPNRTHKITFADLSDKQNERKGKYMLEQSGGLYRNLITSDNSFEDENVKYERPYKRFNKKNYLSNKTGKTKRVDEPLTWVLRDNKN